MLPFDLSIFIVTKAVVKVVRKTCLISNIFYFVLFRYSVRWHRVHCMFRNCSTERANHCCINLIQHLKYFTGPVRICTSSRAIQKVCRLELESKCDFSLFSYKIVLTEKSAYTSKNKSTSQNSKKLIFVVIFLLQW